MKIKVFSFNLRTDTTYDEINYLPNRIPRIKELISSEKPDIIGFQEVREMGREFLTEALSDYTVLGCGRYEDYRREGLSIAYRKDKFDIISLETDWLSLTPGIPASTYGGDQSECPRTVQTAVLLPREGGEPFTFCNVHLDHIGIDARRAGAVQVLQKILSKPFKFILTGDFNAVPDEKTITCIKDCNVRRITDITDGIKRTFHAYGKCDADSPFKIDYIFTDMERFENVHLIEDTHPGGIYYTDHYIVSGEIEL